MHEMEEFPIPHSPRTFPSGSMDADSIESPRPGSTLGRLSGFMAYSSVNSPRAGLERADSDASEQQPEVVNTSKYLKASKDNFPLHRYVMWWTLGLSAATGLIVWVIENDVRPTDLWSCLYLGVSCVTCSGLSTLNLMHMSTPSLVVLTAGTFLGSSVLRSLVPVIVRMHYLEARIPRNLRTFDLTKYKSLPLWIVEYKSLQLILRIVLVYQVVFFGLGALALYALTKTLGEEHVMYDPHQQHNGHHRSQASAAGFAIFTAVSAFCNCGFGLRPDFRGNVSFWVIITIDILCLAGNTFFPVILRWILIALSNRSAVDSNRKVFFRYLLMNGRNHYTHLFTSQQTWLLVTMQFVFITSQSMALVWLGSGINVNEAVFESINTRHAGFSSIIIRDQNAGILVLFLAMMFLAPTPFAIVLHRSDAETPSQPVESRLHRSASLHMISGLTTNSDGEDDDGDGDETYSSGAHDDDGYNVNERAGDVSPLTPDDIDIETQPTVGDVDDHLAPRLAVTAEGAGEKLRQRSVGWRVPWEAAKARDQSTDRMKSRSLAIHLAESGTQGDVRDTVDTRLMLLKKYGGARVPLSVKVSARVEALGASLAALWDESQQESMAREIGVLWFAWFFILCVERYTPNHDAHSDIFSVVFEICSAYGNVGLTMGAVHKRDVAFSFDLHAVSQATIMLIMVCGRMRDLPKSIDGTLELTTSIPEEGSGFLRRKAATAARSAAPASAALTARSERPGEAPGNATAPFAVMEPHSAAQAPSQTARALKPTVSFNKPGSFSDASQGDVSLKDSRTTLQASLLKA